VIEISRVAAACVHHHHCQPPDTAEITARPPQHPTLELPLPQPATLSLTDAVPLLVAPTRAPMSVTCCIVTCHLDANAATSTSLSCAPRLSGVLGRKCAPAATENGEIGLENKTEEKLNWTIRETGGIDVRDAAMSVHETTRHRELMHLVVQHPYYAVSNTRWSAPKPVSTRPSANLDVRHE